MTEKNKKILVLTPRLPYPVIGGDKLRIYNVCKKLKKAGFDLDLVSFVESEEEREAARSHPKNEIFSDISIVKLPKRHSYIKALLGFFNSDPLQVNYYDSNRMQALVDERLSRGNYDSVLVHLIRMAQYVLGKDTHKVLEMTDAISLNYKRNKEVGRLTPRNVAYSLDEKRTLKYEEKCLESFDSSVVVSSVDKDYLLDELGSGFESKIEVIPNGVSDEFLKAKGFKSDSSQIIFVGNLRSKQNQDSIFYFIDKIYPIIRKKNPNARLKVVGAEPPQKLLNMDGKNGIEVTGRVEDIIESLKGARVSVAPIRIGAGIQNKILESMALGIPVVTNTIGSEGIEGAKDGTHFLVADDPSDFAKSVLKILDDDKLYEKLTKNGRKLVESDYIFDEMLEPYPNLFN